jgi:uncharacterized protein (UPF0371 family)
MKKSKTPFNLNKYLRLQKAAILDRIKRFDGKLYLEFGGKLFDDEHAARVLPGFSPDSKVKALIELKNKLEIIVCINSYDIIYGKVRGDNGVSYQDEVLRMIDLLRQNDLLVSSVVVTKYQAVPAVQTFRKYLENNNINVYAHYEIPNYPYDTDLILSPEGFGKNDQIVTKKPLVAVTAPGPGSGKMGVCLSLLYQDFLNGKKSGYAKYETFPTWNLSLNHPLNLAYEAATLDLNDELMIDHYYVAAHAANAVSYNRDLDAFLLLQKIFEKIYGVSPYASPTEMGINELALAIEDDDKIRDACEQEIIRRYYHSLWQYKLGILSDAAIDKLNLIMEQGNINLEKRISVKYALRKQAQTGRPSAAISLNNKKVVTGKKSALFTQSAAAVINALKYYGKIKKTIPLLSENLLMTIQKLKKDHLHSKDVELNVNEVLIALAITANTGPLSQVALKSIDKLQGNQLHSTHVLEQTEIMTLHKLGIDVTFEPNPEQMFIK